MVTQNNRNYRYYFQLNAKQTNQAVDMARRLGYGDYEIMHILQYGIDLVTHKVVSIRDDQLLADTFGVRSK